MQCGNADVDRVPVVTYAKIVARGWILVALVSSNTVLLANGELGLAAVGGMAISTVWWMNSSKNREDVPYAAIVYGIGAGFGTLTGALIAQWLG